MCTSKHACSLALVLAAVQHVDTRVSHVRTLQGLDQFKLDLLESLSPGIFRSSQRRKMQDALPVHAVPRHACMPSVCVTHCWGRMLPGRAPTVHT